MLLLVCCCVLLRAATSVLCAWRCVLLFDNSRRTLSRRSTVPCHQVLRLACCCNLCWNRLIVVLCDVVRRTVWLSAISVLRDPPSCVIPKHPTTNLDLRILRSPRLIVGVVENRQLTFSNVLLPLLNGLVHPILIAWSIAWLVVALSSSRSAVRGGLFKQTIAGASSNGFQKAALSAFCWAYLHLLLVLVFQHCYGNP